MNKEQYLEWLKTRGEAETWERAKCHAADELIKRTTLENADKLLQKEISDKHLRQFTMGMLRNHFGSAEVDAICMHLGVYPSWMEGMK